MLDARKQLITHVVGTFEPDTVGDVDGDAMCLNIKLQTAVRPSLLSLISSLNGCNEYGGGGGGMCSTQALLVPSLCPQQDIPRYLNFN